MIITQEILVDQVTEFNSITNDSDMRELYPTIICRVNRISPEKYLITIDDNNNGNAEDFLADVFERMDIE